MHGGMLVCEISLHELDSANNVIDIYTFNNVNIATASRVDDNVNGRKEYWTDMGIIIQMDDPFVDILHEAMPTGDEQKQLGVSSIWSAVNDHSHTGFLDSLKIKEKGVQQGADTTRLYIARARFCHENGERHGRE